MTKKMLLDHLKGAWCGIVHYPFGTTVWGDEKKLWENKAGRQKWVVIGKCRKCGCSWVK